MYGFFRKKYGQFNEMRYEYFYNQKGGGWGSVLCHICQAPYSLAFIKIYCFTPRVKDFIN